MNPLKLLIGYPWIHLEIMRGSIKQNERYCAKERIYTHLGLPFIGKGGRRDQQVYFNMIREGKSDLELAEHDFGLFSRTLKATDRIRLMMKPKRTEPRDVILVHGPPGVGKTRSVYEEYPDLYEAPIGKDLWLDGYAGEDVVLLDEFEGMLKNTSISLTSKVVCH